jgi:hypothetical protein
VAHDFSAMRFLNILPSPPNKCMETSNVIIEIGLYRMFQKFYVSQKRQAIGMRYLGVQSVFEIVG